MKSETGCVTRLRVLELFEVDLVAGELRRRKPYGRAKAGVRPGYTSKNGYRIVCIDYRNYFEHNVVWFMTHGAWLTAGFEVDHKNGDKLDNRPSNMRRATRSQNMANASLRRDNVTGERGVYFDTSRKMYMVQVSVNKRLVFSGRFKTKRLAAAAARAVREKHWGEFNRAA